MIEALGIKHNISWGACHFNFPWKRKNVDLKHCPPIRKQQPGSKKVYWHYPLQYLPMEAFPMNPYDNILDLDYATRPKRFFAVVRNPYDRMVSFFYHGKSGAMTVAEMNQWIQRGLQKPWLAGLRYSNSSMCQYPYFYHHDGKNNTTPQRMVDHLLHFETLANEFAQLANDYGLNMSIPSRKINARKHNTAGPTTKDLSNKTIDMLNRLCPQDFELGRGYSMIHVEI